MVYLVIAFLFLAAMAAFMWSEAQRNEVVTDVLRLQQYPCEQPLTLFFISDIHRRSIHPAIIEKIRGKVDIVIIGGDLAEKNVPLQRVSDNLQLLQQAAPVFFVWGNNDYEFPAEELTSLFEKHSICALRNESVCLPVDCKRPVYLLGVDDFSKGNSDKRLAFKEVPENAFKIFISHNPVLRKQLSPADGVSLFLSGHTHGGQIRFFGFGPYKKGGWEQEGEMAVLVSNGYGTSAVPLRLGARAETHLITIKRG